MPGLLRGMTRTAVVVGTATAVSNNVSRRQYNRWNEQEQAQQTSAQASAQPGSTAQPQPNGDPADPYTEIEKLGRLKEQGLITQAEFDSKKQQLLGL